MARLWLIDFDGTLVDSEKAIKACYLKITLKLVPERLSFIKTMVIGPTLDETSRMILTKKNYHLLDKFKKNFQSLYDNKLVLETPQYPTVNDALEKLNGLGDHIGIITNKRMYPTKKLIDLYNWHHLFIFVACMDQYPKAQSKSDLISFLKINKNEYEKIYLVGDTISDGIAGRVHKIPFIRAEYGYGKKENWLRIPIYKKIQKFNEIISIK